MAPHERKTIYLSHLLRVHHGKPKRCQCVRIPDKLATRRANLYLPDAIVDGRNEE